MKDQYFGDISDYRKYGLLRAISEASGLRWGICWLRTANDAGRDGEFRDYLHHPERWRQFDPLLYEGLRRLLEPGIKRSTTHAEQSELIPGATYQHRVLTDRSADRSAYWTETWHLMRDSPLLFLDPDNGIEVSSVKAGRKDSSKYVYWAELEEAAARGHSVLVYQHFPRIPRERFVADVSEQLRARLDSPWVAVFRTAHVGFFLAAQAGHVEALRRVSGVVAERWAGQVEVG